MLDLDTRTAILRLAGEGHGVRTIARILNLSRGAVRKVLHSGVAEVPALERDEILAPHLERVRELYVRCKGNRVRMLEELNTQGLALIFFTQQSREKGRIARRLLFRALELAGQDLGDTVIIHGRAP